MENAESKESDGRNSQRGETDSFLRWGGRGLGGGVVSNKCFGLTPCIPNTSKLPPLAGIPLAQVISFTVKRHPRDAGERSNNNRRKKAIRNKVLPPE